MSDEAKKRARGLWIWLAAILLLLAYPLSMGPAYRLAYHSHDRTTHFETVGKAYAPIWWLERHSDWAAIAIQWYLRTWVRYGHSR